MIHSLHGNVINTRPPELEGVTRENLHTQPAHIRALYYRPEVVRTLRELREKDSHLTHTYVPSARRRATTQSSTQTTLNSQPQGLSHSLQTSSSTDTASSRADPITVSNELVQEFLSVEKDDQHLQQGKGKPFSDESASTSVEAEEHTIPAPKRQCTNHSTSREYDAERDKNNDDHDRDEHQVDKSSHSDEKQRLTGQKRKQLEHSHSSKMVQSRTPHRNDWKKRMYAYACRHPGYACKKSERPRTRKQWIYRTNASPLCAPPNQKHMPESRLRSLYWVPEDSLPMGYELQTWFKRDMNMQPTSPHADEKSTRVLYSYHYEPPPGNRQWLGVPPIYGQTKWGPPGHDLRKHGEPLSQTASIDRLRPMDPIQEEAVNCSMRDLKSLGGSVQNVACGTGKTRNASELIYNLGRRTLIVVPNELILKMWANDVFTETPQDQYDAQIDAETYERQKQGVTKRPWLFGVTATVLREKYEENPRNKRRKEQELAENADIVITTVQTLYSSMFPAHFLNRFGSIGFDEVHHLNKPKYSEVLQLLPMRYRFGISATAERRDGTSLALYYNVGPLSVFYERTEDLTGLRNMMHVVNIALTPPAPKYLLKSFTDLYAQFRRKLNKNENAMYALSNMAYLTADDPLRRHIIAVLIAYILHNNVRQKIVTFTEYCAQSLHLVEAIRQATGYEVPVLFSEVSVKDHWSRLRQLYGNMPEKPTRANKMEFQKRMYEAVNSKEYPVFVGTDKFLNEGFDCPDIDCVIFASDLKDVKQHLGRAQRPRPGKSIPLCIDVHCNFEPWTKRARDRRALYTHLGYHVDDVNIPYMATNDRSLPEIEQSVAESPALVLSQLPTLRTRDAHYLWRELQYILHHTPPVEDVQEEK